jgi:hypothetical protein
MQEICAPPLPARSMPAAGPTDCGRLWSCCARCPGPTAKSGCPSEPPARQTAAGHRAGDSGLPFVRVCLLLFAVHLYRGKASSMGVDLPGFSLLAYSKSGCMVKPGGGCNTECHWPTTLALEQPGREGWESIMTPGKTVHHSPYSSSVCRPASSCMAAGPAETPPPLETAGTTCPAAGGSLSRPRGPCRQRRLHLVSLRGASRTLGSQETRPQIAPLTGSMRWRAGRSAPHLEVGAFPESSLARPARSFAARRPPRLWSAGAARMGTRTNLAPQQSRKTCATGYNPFVPLKNTIGVASVRAAFKTASAQSVRSTLVDRESRHHGAQGHALISIELYS